MTEKTLYMATTSTFSDATSRTNRSIWPIALQPMFIALFREAANPPHFHQFVVLTMGSTLHTIGPDSLKVHSDKWYHGHFA